MSNLFYSKFKVMSRQFHQTGPISRDILRKFSFIGAYILTSCSIFLDCLDQELMVMIYGGQDSVKDMSCHQ